jgi:DNA-binding NarL/FixJ family response regulator
MNHFANLQYLRTKINNRKIFINFGELSALKSKLNLYSYCFDERIHVEPSMDFNDGLSVLKPAIYVIYFSSCGENEIRFLSYLQKSSVILKIIVISDSADVNFVIRAFRCGILDFICKDLTLALLGPALIEADSEINALVETESIKKNATEKLNLLTRREREVLNGLSDGLQNKIIASNLNLSVRTIEMFRSTIMEKLQVKNATEAVKLLLSAERPLQ